MTTIQLPHTIENHLGEKLVFKGLEKVNGEDRVIVENFLKPGAGPVMHVHFKQDESLTVRQGKMAYQLLGQEPVYLNIGETVVFKRGQAHRFWNAGEDTLHCEGWVQPANSFVYFLSALYTAMNKSGKAEPEPFDGAFLMTRYRTEYDLPEIPGFIKNAIMPITVFFGRLLGKYGHFQDAPAPLK